MHSTERGSKDKVQQLRMMGRDDGNNAGELKSVTHAFHPRGPGGTCPGRHEPSAQETDPPTEV